MYSNQEKVEFALEKIRQFSEDVVDAQTTFGGYDNLCLNRVYQNSVLYCFSQIGEFASWIDAWLKREIPSVPWERIIAFRNVSVHQYHHIEPISLWNTMNEDIPKLIEVLGDISNVHVGDNETIQTPTRMTRRRQKGQ